MDLYQYSKNLEMLQEIPPKFDRKVEFDFKRAQIQIQKGLLNKNLCLTATQTNAVLNAYGIPVHESKSMISNQKVEQNTQQYELEIGSKRDRDFGPVIFFGIGGIMAELLKDRAVALPPLNRLLARELMKKTKIYTLIKEFKNHTTGQILFQIDT